MKRLRDYLKDRHKTRKTLGILAVVIGFFALVTPLTPGSWLIFVGLELLGVDLLLWDRLKKYFKRGQEEQK